MRSKKGIILASCMTTIFLLAGIVAVTASDSIKLEVNGHMIQTDVPPQIINNRMMVPVRSISEALGAKVNWNKEGNKVEVDMTDVDSPQEEDKSLQRQVELLRNWIAPVSANKAVETWAEAVKQRNGAVQYAMFAPDVQEQTREQLKRFNWVTGVSSPWVERYEINEQKVSAEDAVKYEVIFHMATSTGSAGTAHASLTVSKGDGGWLITELLNDGSSNIPGVNDKAGDGSTDSTTGEVLKHPQAVQMINDKIGWAWESDPLKVVKTIDGGQHWKEVPLTGLDDESTASISQPAFEFLDADHGWISWTNDKEMVIAYTADGGRHWSQTSIPGYNMAVDFTFLNDQEGWLLTVGDAAMMKSEKRVFRTIDGGETWELLSSNTDYLESDEATRNALSLTGTANGIIFSDAEHGWVSLDNPVSDELLFYQTVDGGKSWSPVELNVPEEVEGEEFITSFSVPQFFGSQKKEGIVIARFAYRDEQSTVAFRTMNGGESWDGELLPAEVNVENVSDMTFAARDRGWAIVDDGLYRTRDGLEWEKVSTNKTFNETLKTNSVLKQIVFVDNMEGWILAASEDLEDEILLKTEDGGETWKQAPIKG
ncbi:stalk domain-containing protein [Alkalihalobacillus oceani]|uniref:Stalk domain-containing protein n=1 Tax=Halalkalibacter oceani TaxID=1653776 RepID=A0A9X2IQC8_9BACI|nr:stalk domain-containing protein [Halalkalibacter oceani]MCM3715342.1 stalk domain-containing protein [Halalkalibacter oceani]